ncbi:putative acetylserotonin methytransferase-like protein [Erysiphe neolycopersici]|uniref:Putative acetylserotonin methytransferase-like protein n=1 Tax=Erysiphe neolycopersici TaxID=212602 RepID=A0A420HPA1_9PEZI|nr:putative acetylserotonin methytransferase-like protein [Erysiphe neolycopersici]
MACEVSLILPIRGNSNNGSDFVGSMRGTYRSASDARRSSLAGRYQPQYRDPTSRRGVRSSTERDPLSGSESLEHVEKSLKSSKSLQGSSNRLSLDPSCPQLPPIEPTIELLSEAHIACHIVLTDTDLTETIIIDRNDRVPSQVNSEHARFSKDNKLILNSNLINEPRLYNSTPAYLTHLPPAFLARRGYLPSIDSTHLQSPIELDLQDEIILEPSRRDELRELWNCASGWQVSPYEGRRFCLKITTVCADVPIYVLSSSTQAFYSIKYIATPNSTQMSVMRYDPEKSASISILGFSKLGKGIDVVSTTLEKNARKIPPEDGLVALLYPRAASNKFIQLATRISKRDTHEVAAAALEKECGRLVWEVDSGSYFLCHPAMRTPFLISITTTPDSSTIKYMLEHTEFQRDVVTLVRDAAGDGFLEINTSCVTQIESTCIIDVAVSAIMLVAILTEEKMLEIDRINMALAMELKRQSQLVTQESNNTLGTEYDDQRSVSDIESQNGKPNEQKEETDSAPALGVLESMIKRILNALIFILKIFQPKKEPHEEIK